MSRETLAKVLAEHGEQTDLSYDRHLGCDCGWHPTDKWDIHGSRVEYDLHLADVLAAHVRAKQAEALREALDSRETPGMLRAMLLDAADRLDNPAHKGNAHPWPKHAAMFRRAADRIEGQ